MIRDTLLCIITGITNLNKVKNVFKMVNMVTIKIIIITLLLMIRDTLLCIITGITNLNKVKNVFKMVNMITIEIILITLL